MSITLWEYYLNRAEKLSKKAFVNINSADDWEKTKGEIKTHFLKSVGLFPFPQKPDLKITELGEFKGDGWIAKKIAYQILPDCWSTGCLYLPDPLPEQKVPAVLYVCGHQYAGTIGYQHHSILWAKRGYGCFIFDTLEQNDNPGSHKGLLGSFRLDWLARGYSAAGGEILNSTRAIDVLCAFPQIDTDRIGATGISGGGAHSFYITAIDERIKAVATVAGVATQEYTLKHRHFIGHCDCMYYHNIFLHDAAEIAGLIAPRPLLFCFASEDSLFSPEEYTSLYERTQKIYKLLGAEDKLELFEYPGPHKYQPETIQKINEWFDKYVAGKKHVEAELGEPQLSAKVISVFSGKVPQPDRTEILPELLTPQISIKLPDNLDEFKTIKSKVVDELKSDVFYSIINDKPAFEFNEVGRWWLDTEGGNRIKYLAKIDNVEVWIELWSSKDAKDNVIIGVVNRNSNVDQVRGKLWTICSETNATGVFIEPRCSGYTAPSNAEYENLLRAGVLTGKTPTMLVIEDLLNLIPEIKKIDILKDNKFYLYGAKDAGIACLYYGLFDDNIEGFILEGLPLSHKYTGDISGILRFVDIHHAIGLLAPRKVAIVNTPLPRSPWCYKVYDRLTILDRYILTGSTDLAILRILGATK